MALVIFLILMIIAPPSKETAVASIIGKPPTSTVSVVVINALCPNTLPLSIVVKSLIVIVSGKYPSAPTVPPPGNAVAPAANENT